jgi:hypothetical protein
VNKNMRFVIAGVALGAVAGAIAGLLYTRAMPAEGVAEGVGQEPPADLDLPQIARLGLLVLGTVRQILALT